MKKILITLLTSVFMAGMVSMAHSSSCLNSDMQLNGFAADACSGPNSGNDSAGGLNDLGYSDSLFRGNEFTFVAKDETLNGQASSIGELDGIYFSLRSTGGTSGTWYLTWSGASLPATVDLVAVLKGSSSWSAYLFDNELLNATGSNGTGDSWAITFTNNGGQIPDLSHLTLYARDVEQTPVPEPGTMVLLGAGMLGLAIFGKRRMNRE
ncbi:PEP-CTERM sorting domain-containing protein [Pelobacter propionicus]|uniref:Ice-binding protein C-terminal domain-containing protein n=1 Tax=Pelobacter propionicus (strain DSM 2379 / NBRC 103807 / OttBd1) TaxID=338966 RepID=A1AS63_PELPD|nr:PEP-CTERM sorting domain-containing protein [Pelobacter propionicus]ABL00184.1 conserved hypothetical protein [Pelobacter propionicus DSM 2379]